MLSRAFSHGRQQRGLSLVELLIGVALGLFLVAGAITLFVGNAGSSRRLLTEARINQDMRTAADLIARDLRRAGFWADAIKATAAPLANPFADVVVGYAAPAPAPNQIEYAFDRRYDAALDGSDQFGFRLRDGEIQMKTAVGIWQPITDDDVLQVTTFQITAVETPITVGAACPKACPPPTWETYTCPVPEPTLTLRRYDILIQGHASADASVTRQLQESVRVRNDQVVGACPS